MSFREYLSESESLEKNLSPILKDLYFKYGEQIFETIPTFNPDAGDLAYIFKAVVDRGFNSGLKPIPINILEKLESPNKIASFVITISSDPDGNLVTRDPEIQLLDVSPFFIYQLTNILAHEIIHYDDYINGAGEDAAKAECAGAKKTYDDHGILFKTKMEQLNAAFDLDITVKYDKSADHHLDKNRFLNMDRKTEMKRKIAQMLDFDKNGEIDSHILFEDEENISDKQIELVKAARQLLKKHPGADVKIFKDYMKLYIY